MNFFIAQLNPIVGDLEGNAKKILNVTGKAYSNSADMVPVSYTHLTLPTNREV